MKTYYDRNGMPIEVSRISRMYAWYLGWKETLYLMIFDRETYNYLKNHEFDDSEFVEVNEPE